MQLSSFLRTVIRCCVGASSLCIAQLSAQNNLASQVTIYRDTYGIPHVFGETDAATMFGFAYAQAEDNFWRIEDNYIRAIGRRTAVEGPVGPCDALHQSPSVVLWSRPGLRGARQQQRERLEFHRLYALRLSLSVRRA